MVNNALPTIAILGGTGKEGPGLALRLAMAGYPIIIGSRQLEKAQATMEIIPQIKEFWDSDRDELLGSAHEILDHLKQGKGRPSGQALDLDASFLDKGYMGLTSLYDPQNGGFGIAPKLPAPHNLFFLLRYWKRTGDMQALQMVESTLQAMRMGGIYDHVGF